MKILFFLLILILSSLAAWGNSASECADFSNFTNSLLCKKSEITYREMEGKNTRMIHTELGAIVSSQDFKNENDLIAIFLDFDSWGDYAKREGSDVLKIRSSKKLPTLTKNGKEVFRHYTHFGTKAPAPLYRQWVRTVISYWEIPKADRALVTYKFLSDKGVNKIDGEELLVGSEGMQHYEGIISIYYSETTNEFLVYTEFWLIPSINILPQFAIPSIERGLIALVKGMFDI